MLRPFAAGALLAAAAVAPQAAVPLVVAAVFAQPAAAQIPDTFTNLQVLPETIARDSLIAVMRSFSLGLGVRCQYCHVGGDGMSFDGVRFADDDDEDKRKARYMLRMVATINGELLGGLPDRDQPGFEVACVTCHRGLARPRTLEATLAETVHAAGADSAVAHYRNLRETFYGTGTYDFSPQPLLELAGTLVRLQKIDEATRITDLNAEFFPAHAPTWLRRADIRLLAADTAAAIAALEKVLELQPQNAQVTARLRELRRPPS
jgi:tetratricopeptide (TPR) repeat protein